MSRKAYPSDLSEKEWKQLKPLLPPENLIGSPREVELREVVNALMYVADNGIKWRALPHDFPAWQTVYGYFRRWSQSGLWEQINTTLGKQVRRCAGRDEQPSLVMVDSQSVEMAQKGDLNTASMVAKRLRDALRHIVVDVLGLVLYCFVSAANVADVKAAPVVLIPALEANARIQKILALL